ncbi:SNF2-related domain-containing protein [Cavenderia fasciculata]|uniref:SNF2-related domain-containing protein n=1 Tax=Cavenderia fasciculata TaxID=261658 RepID=F4Q2N2_CACFS|nr:SNF2-related domain-containing protein [Cavenderia fasciculata]EGG17499.1 SNF2-related domain-containing protein [Cavenderia fasciculata]|eukprot:XP_004355983.1 SNF2-related domain-containing protein [Cavenderia fasciculata]
MSSKNNNNIITPTPTSARKTPKISRAMLDRVKNIKSTFLIDVDQDTTTSTATATATTSTSTTNTKDKEVIEIPETPIQQNKKKNIDHSSEVEDITKSISKQLSISKPPKQQQQQQKEQEQEQEEEEEEEIVTRRKPTRKLVLEDSDEDEVDKPLNIIGKLEKEMDKPMVQPEEQKLETKTTSTLTSIPRIFKGMEETPRPPPSKEISIDDDDDDEDEEGEEIGSEDSDDDPFEDDNDDDDPFEEDKKEKPTTSQEVTKPSRLKKLQKAKVDKDEEEEETQGEDIGLEDSEDEEDEDDEYDEDDEDFIDDDDDDEDYEDSEEEEEEEEYIPPPTRTKKLKPTQSQKMPIMIESDDDEEDEEEEEEEESEEEEEVSEPIKRKTRKGNNTIISTISKKKQIQEEEEDNSTTTPPPTTQQDEYEDQSNGFNKNLRTGKYHNSLQFDGRDFIVPADTYDNLFWYQRDGLDWMWRLFCRKAGGILGDDMGLGKTMQIISFLKSMHHGKFINYSLVAMPVSLIEHWVKEFDKKKPTINVRVYHGANVRERENNLEYIKRNGGVLITTYGMIVSNSGPLKEYKRKTFKWDYIILDEGHKIKETKTKINKTIRELTANFKIIMTGTAIQNNLKELWSLFDWVCNGTLLGSIRSFSMHFQNPILRAHISDSSFNEKKMGSAVAESLRQLIAPHFLRREKKDVFPATSNSSAEPENRSPPVDMDNTENVDPNNIPSPTSSISSSTSSSSTSSSTSSHIVKSLKTKRMSVKGIRTRKNDFVCWIKMAQPQIDLYKVFLESAEVKNALNKTSSPLAALTVLKKIADHPALIHEEMKTCNTPEMLDIMKQIGENQTIKSLVRNSGKMQFLYYLLPNLKQEGHRILIFSQSVKMLNAIQLLLDTLNLSYLRIDGSITSTKERQKRIDEYNNDSSYFCFLLTIQVGALGLNLTSADRVLIFDPSWTTVDNQAVDRVYRIGQKRDVVVYRLITCGTIEEKIYRKQVFKGSLMKSMLNQDKGQHRYFSNEELGQVFRLDDPTESQTQRYLEDLHSKNRKSSPELDIHIQFLMKFKMVFGISDHDLLFSEEVGIDHTEEDVKSVQGKDMTFTPSKQPSKKKITIVTKDTPGKSTTQVNKYIYLNDEYDDDDDEEEMIVDRAPTGSGSSSSNMTSTSSTTSTSNTKQYSNLKTSYDIETGKEVIHINESPVKSEVSSHYQQQRQQQKPYPLNTVSYNPPASISSVPKVQQQQQKTGVVSADRAIVIQKFNSLVQKANELYKQGHKHRALNSLLDASQIDESPKLREMISRIFNEINLEKKE